MPEKFDPYRIVTDKIISYIEEGKFEKLPELWSRQGQPRNAATCRLYSGINVLLLSIRTAEEGWKYPLFLTFKQIVSVSKRFQQFAPDGKYAAILKKGAVSERICFWKGMTIEEEDDSGSKTSKTIPLLRLYSVFNIDQIEMIDEVRTYLTRGIPPRAEAKESIELDDPYVEMFLNSIGSNVRHGGQRAAYNWNEDRIFMPDKKSFESTDAYYAVRFHEEIHRTGHESRLKRNLKSRFSTESYAFEELVAELGAAFLCADFNVYQKNWRHHAEYVRIWLGRMKQDKTAIFHCSKLATSASNYLWEQQPVEVRKSHEKGEL